jgi:hypothetical protein
LSLAALRLRCRGRGRFFRMGDRVVDCARLESVCAERHRGFESPPIRSHRRMKTRGDCITVSHNKLADFNAVQRCIAKSSFRVAHSLPSRKFKVCARTGRSLRKERAFFFSRGRGWLPHTPTGRCWHSDRPAMSENDSAGFELPIRKT